MPSNTRPRASAHKRQARVLAEPKDHPPASTPSGEAGANGATLRVKPNLPSRRSQLSSSAHICDENRITIATAGLGDDGAHPPVVTPYAGSPIIVVIIQFWRLRQRLHRAEKSLILQGKAICRSWCSGDKIEANRLFDTPGDRPPELAISLIQFDAAIKGFSSQRKPIEKRLKALAESLPISPWVAAVKGFGQPNLAALVGEAGDIGSYRNPACLWKRFGLAVIGGQRQRKVKDKELAILMGYSPARHAVAYLLSDCLIKNNKATGKYRPVYDQRKAYELARTDENKPESLGHAHNRAARYMVKRVLRDLWSAWRRADVAVGESPTDGLPAAEIPKAA